VTAGPDFAPEGDRLITVAEAARLLQQSPTTVRTWAAKGLLPGVLPKIGGKSGTWRVNERILLEAADYDDPTTFRQRLGDVLGELAPADHVEVRGVLVPFLGLAVLPAPVDRQAEAGRRLPRREEPELRVAGQVPDDSDLAVGHGSGPLLACADRTGRL
jgi:hypothetical protein